jgi:hypothetical protein
VAAAVVADLSNISPLQRAARSLQVGRYQQVIITAIATISVLSFCTVGSIYRLPTAASLPMLIAAAKLAQCWRLRHLEAGAEHLQRAAQQSSCCSVSYFLILIIIIIKLPN